MIVCSYLDHVSQDTTTSACPFLLLTHTHTPSLLKQANHTIREKFNYMARSHTVAAITVAEISTDRQQCFQIDEWVHTHTHTADSSHPFVLSGVEKSCLHWLLSKLQIPGQNKCCSSCKPLHFGMDPYTEIDHKKNPDIYCYVMHVCMYMSILQKVHIKPELRSCEFSNKSLKTSHVCIQSVCIYWVCTCMCVYMCD